MMHSSHDTPNPSSHAAQSQSYTHSPRLMCLSIFLSSPAARSAYFTLQGTEGELPLQTVCHHHSLLFIKFMIIEGATLVHLTQLDLVKAQRDMLVLLDLCATYPTLLGQPLHSSMSMLIGQPSSHVTAQYFPR